jgi:uncharacterized sulfatase
MKRLVFLTLLSGLMLPRPVLAAEPAKPNIIVFYTDDHGYADLGMNGSVNDIKTPNLDALARSGVLAKNGYSTAPQCVPSRAGLLVGRFQARFGVESNGGALDGFNKSTTIAERLQAEGYVTAQFGKWHLGPETAIPQHGFKHFFAHAGQATLTSNITIDGKDRPLDRAPATRYHIDGCSQAAAAIIERYRNDPFFLYVAFRAPHTPLDAPKSYTARFPGEMPERRRQALAMLAAVDDGVGLIVETLKKHDLTQRTLIFVIGDNGAPLKIHKVDAPLNQDAGGWDGSLNTPLNGEKGMLSEGGMHVPFIVSWPGTIPAGQAYGHPVSSLDVAATAVALAGARTQPGELDGVNLVPHLKGEIKTPPHDALYWRWIAQSAIREGDWKLLRGGNREYLYNLATDIAEKHNLADKNPEIAGRLRAKLTAWSAQLSPTGITAGAMAPAWNQYFDHYLDGKTISSPPGGKGKTTANIPKTMGWTARNGDLTGKDGILQCTSGKGAPFLVRTGLDLKGPVTAKITLKTSNSGKAGFAWRLSDQKDFLPANRKDIQVIPSDDWQTHEIQLPAAGTIIHLRLHLPAGTTQLREIHLQPASK